MRGLVVVGCTLVGCATTPIVSSESHDGDIAVATPTVRRAAFSVVGAELGDTGAVDRIRGRARLLRYGRAASKADGDQTERGGVVELPWLPIMPVIGETAERIRIVATDDHARVALWIDRADIAPTVRADVQLADERGRAPRGAGVWLDAGAPIDVARSDVLGGMQRVALHDRSLRAGGWVAKPLVGEVWVAAPDDRRPTAVDNTTWGELGDAGQGAAVLAGAIRVAPRGDARVVAEVVEPVGATIVRRAGDWTEIAVKRPYARIRGFVPASRVGASDQAIGHGGGIGVGFGMSDTWQLDVGPGVCLYDEQDGEVIGVNLDQVSRYREHSARPGWWEVHVATRWGTVRVLVHELTGTRDPAQVKLETCAR